MPYKVVQTIERGETCLTVIPSRWEENGILHWPKKNAVAKLSLEEFSVLSPKWERINCVKKREFTTRAEAESELERMESVSDTEADEAIVTRPPPSKKNCPETSRNGNTIKDFNDVFLIPGQEVEDAQITATDEVQIQTNNTPTDTIMLFTTGPNECAPGPSTMVLRPEEIAKDQLNINIISNQQAILGNQQVIVNNQIKVMQAIAKMQTGLDYLIENNMFGNAQPKDPTKILLQPVDSLLELKTLEESLKEDAVVQKYITNMAFICGTDGKASGMDSCYKLIDCFITREFMHTCSWTGNTKASDENNPMNTQSTMQPEASGKVPLKFFANFRSLFLKLIRLADKDFTEVKCDEFFKRVMKNSKARLHAKSSSKHKNRPSNLKYKSRKFGETSDVNRCSTPEEATVEESLQPTQQA